MEVNSPGASATGGAGGLGGGWLTVGALGGAAGGFAVGALNILVNSPGSSVSGGEFRIGAFGGS